MLGWNLNALVFVVNIVLAFKIIRSNDVVTLHKESEILNELKDEFEELYPNRGLETMISYIIPFTAFFRVGWRLVEMVMFFNKNEGTRMFDFMVYKYQSDIQKAKNN
jgi:hypothetical protein